MTILFAGVSYWKALLKSLSDGINGRLHAVVIVKDAFSATLHNTALFYLLMLLKQAQ